MAQHKAELCGQAVGGDLLNRSAVQIGDNALQAHILPDVGFQYNLLALLHNAVHGRGDDQNAVGFGNFCVIQGGAGLADLIIDVCIGQFNGGGSGASALTHNVVGVCVNLRDNHFTLLAGQSLGSFQHSAGFVKVQSVNHEVERAVLCQLEQLSGGGQRVNVAVTAAVAGALAVVVVHLCSGHVVNANAVCTHKAVILIGYKAALGFVLEELIHSVLIFRYKINCHL